MKPVKPPFHAAVHRQGALLCSENGARGKNLELQSSKKKKSFNIWNLVDPPFTPKLFRIPTKRLLLWFLINGASGVRSKVLSLTDNGARLFLLHLIRVKCLITKQI